jgi:UDP-N-acetylglucosamine transferase subunit ALG13
MASALYVASTGGHLDELVRLAARFEPAGDAVEWVTSDSEQSTELLDGEVRHPFPDIPPKQLLAALRAVPAAYRLLGGRRYERVVSTGAAIAVPFALAARLRRVPFHYIESAARSAGPSLTGRIIARVPGSHLYTQYPSWADGRWHFRGSLFSGYAPAEPAELPVLGLRRVVVTFGTQRRFGFTRAAEALAKVLPQVLAPGADVLWQTGYTEVAHLGIDGVRMVAPAALRTAIEQADLVVGHAGIGSSLMALEAGRCPLLLPRLAAHGEHTDDHQALIAAELAGRSLALTRDPDALTADDLLEAATLRATPVADPTPFALLAD